MARYQIDFKEHMDDGVAADRTAVVEGTNDEEALFVLGNLIMHMMGEGSATQPKVQNPMSIKKIG